MAMLLYDARLTALVLMPVPLALLLSYATGRGVSTRTRIARHTNALLTAALQEHLAGMRVLRLFGRSGAVGERVAALSQAQAGSNLGIVRLRSGLQPLYSVLITAGIVLLVGQGGLRVVAGALSVGSFVAYLQLYLRFVGRGFRLPQLVNSIQSGGAAYARLQPWLAPSLPVGGAPLLQSYRPGHIVGMGQPVPPQPVRSAGPMAVAVEGLTFRYPDALHPALTSVSLEIPAGAFVAITGPVGAGKSALAAALLGLFPLEAGAVRLDGRAPEARGSVARAARIGYLPQDPFLFSGTVRENVLLRLPEQHDAGPVARAVEEAVTLAALAEDLRALRAGLETEIGELGIRVSGGQRQRIGLARAIAAAAPATPGLLVLDDPFSSFDVDTEAQIIAALRVAFGPAAAPERRATIVLCSHRLAAFPQADHIAVLQGGHVVEQGSHVGLLEAGGLYARIYRAQRQVEQPGRPEASA